MIVAIKFSPKLFFYFLVTQILVTVRTMIGLQQKWEFVFSNCSKGLQGTCRYNYVSNGYLEFLKKAFG